MKKLVLVLFLYCQLPGVNAQVIAYWQQQVNYNIDVALNDQKNELDGYIKMEYFNNSPDTLHFIWMHLWPNAYKNDRTAFSDQLLENGRTDFYFSNDDKRGYINRLAFKENGVLVKMEDHPEHQDIIKLLLPQPLAPNTRAIIESPFHVKIPYNFSRGGYVKKSYQLTQWYPKPAVYDSKGWHPMPYLDQGEFYSEFGNYEVHITTPENYVIAATGELQNEDEKEWLKARPLQQVINKEKEIKNTNKGAGKKTQQTSNNKQGISKKTKTKSPAKKTGSKKTAVVTKNKKTLSKPTKTTSLQAGSNISSPKNIQLPKTKTLIYKQNNVHDFAWFADKKFNVKQDTLQLASGRIITVAIYYLPSNNNYWNDGISYIKKSILTRSLWLGEYPYNTVTVVEASMGVSGGMEYSTITSISPVDSKSTLEDLIEHEIGHNWNYGTLATNEREHPWMDEGINTFYDNRYKIESRQTTKEKESKFLEKRMPPNVEELLLKTVTGIKKDQPIETSSEKFSQINYALVPYTKTAIWMTMIENKLGRQLFDSCMHEFYRRWQFKHPSPEDLKTTFENISGENMDSIFALLNSKGLIKQATEQNNTTEADKRKTLEDKKDFKVMSFFSLKDADKHNYLFIAPALGYNHYDKLMLGAAFHNYTAPFYKLQYFLSPLYATGSKTINGIGRISYSFYPGNNGQKVEVSLAGESFSGASFTDSSGKTTDLRFSKIVPSLKYVFANKNPRSTITKYVQWKTFFIKEQGLLFSRDTVKNIDIITYPSASRYLNQLRFVVDNNRKLYPYDGELKLEQGEGFARLAFNGNYYFNYTKSGGMNVRLFAGKFIYLGDDTYLRQYETDPYHLNMSGARGYEDYTYSNYFIGRNEFEKYPSQQMMIRDGGFKVATDLLSSKVGKTDNWLAAINLTSTIPSSINVFEMLPVKIPVRAFVDIGTYAEAWDKNSTTGRFVYDAGLQVSLLKNTINIYVPLLYSKVYKDYYQSTITENKFWKKIAFSIDIQNLRLKRLIPQLATL